MPKKKPSRDKRLKVDVWVTDGLRQAIGGLVRDDGKPANDAQVRMWAQGEMDDCTSAVVDEFEATR
jgi:hypothetical protein